MAGNRGRTAVKAKPRGRPFPKGNRANPNGRPLKGESYAEIIREIGNMTGDQLADVMVNRWSPELRKEIGPIRMKDALAVRAYLAFFRDAQPSMFNALMDRADGKLPTPIAVGGDDSLGPIPIHVTYTNRPMVGATAAASRADSGTE